MGTERSLEYECECACGKGFYRVYECSPDYGWPSSQRLWYESALDCNVCSKTYQIERRNREFVVVERRIVAEREALRHEAFERGRVLLQSSPVVQLLNTLQALLSSQKSVAAIARLLRRANLSDYSEAAFRNHWHGARSWVQTQVRGDHLTHVMKLLNEYPETVVAELAEIERLSTAGSLPVESIAAPFYKLSGPPYA